MYEVQLLQLFRPRDMGGKEWVEKSFVIGAPPGKHAHIEVSISDDLPWRSLPVSKAGQDTCSIGCRTIVRYSRPRPILCRLLSDLREPVVRSIAS